MSNDEYLSLYRKKIGNILREYREKKGLSAEQLAIASNLKMEYIHLFEQGNHSFLISDLFKIARALDIDPIEFMHQIKAAHRAAKRDRS